MHNTIPTIPTIKSLTYYAPRMKPGEPAEPPTLTKIRHLESLAEFQAGFYMEEEEFFLSMFYLFIDLISS